MQVSVEKVSNTERRLTIIVPAATVEEAYTNQINRYAKTANIKGFRPGKAPISYIQKRFGDEARREALGDVIQSSLQDALEKQALRPVSMPEIMPKNIQPEQAMEFIASFEILPEIEKVNFSLETLEKLVVEVKAEDVDQVLNQLRKQFAQWKPVDRPAKDGDRMKMDYIPILDGQADNSKEVKDHAIELGAQTMIPGFEAGLVGKSAGEACTLNLVFPEDYSVVDQAGKPVSFQVQVNQVLEAEMPALDEAFIRRLGVKSGQESEMKTQIKQSLEQERDRLVSEHLKEQVFKALIEQNPIEIPKALIAREAKAIHDEVHPGHDHHEHTENEMASFNEVAKKRVALGLLVADIAKTSHLKPDAAKVKQKLEQIASVYENPAEVLQWLSTDERIKGIEAQVLEDQVIDKLIENIQINEKVTPYAELKGIRL